MAAVWRLLHRHGWSWQCPARRARGNGVPGRRGRPGLRSEGSHKPRTSHRPEFGGSQKQHDGVAVTMPLAVPRLLTSQHRRHIRRGPTHGQRRPCVIRRGQCPSAASLIQTSCRRGRRWQRIAEGVIVAGGVGHAAVAQAT
ncbi:winged helix-turn-helix domain-containing protein [Streptomyces sp. NPDC005728]|uniref:winged helix-turn-helix domain-containing protein n=1 Tax=Streptomyces sp. NPDC005728 TaxID=3157054 RepID=UPI0033F08D85